ncbi:hypothetical protein J9089_003274 [Salmonella enterica]|nr:hypothetical protein [Salmonella enterica]EHI7757805.1 hypothetical protein [Salmonella enterica]EHI8762948.1 hypothetical protein [Salmonella enterica]
MTTAINAAAMRFAVDETMAHMIGIALEKGQTITVRQISEDIVSNPQGDTAEFFRKHLEIAYRVALEVVNKK